MNRKIHFQNDIFNGWEEDGEPNPERRYEPHALEIPNIHEDCGTPECCNECEPIIFLDPTKYKFNKQIKQEGTIERFLRWLLIG